MIITSKANEKVKFIKNLNDKKFRTFHDAYYLEGIKITFEILKTEEAVNIMFIAYSSEIIEDYELVKLEKICKEKNILTLDFKEDIFKYVCDTVTPQGVLCVLKKSNKNIENEINKYSKENIFILDGIQDMGNLGTIIRNASAFNIKNIICLENTADVYSPKTLRSTMGNILNVNIFYLNFDETLKILNKHDYKVVGTSLDANDKIKDLDFSQKYAFVFGNESNGIRKEVLNSCDKKIKIEMTNNAESLNVSVASGIIGYEQYINKK